MSDNASDSGGVSRVIIGPGRSDQVFYVSFAKLFLSDEANNVDSSRSCVEDLSDASYNRNEKRPRYRTLEGKTNGPLSDHRLRFTPPRYRTSPQRSIR